MAAVTAKLAEASSLSLSVLAHGALLLLLSLNLSLFENRPDRSVRLAIDAAVVLDTGAVQQRQREAERAAAEQRRREQAERQRLEAERRRAEEARVARQREAEAARRADQERAEAAARAERERQVAEEARRAAEAAAKAERERQAAEAARKAAEAAAEAERRREAAARQRQAEREAQLLAQLAAEEEREAAVSAGMQDQWRELIRQSIQRNWVKPASAGPGINCEVRVTQIPGGEVVDVQVTRCNGDDAVVRSIENAVLRASPLPRPPDPSLFERRLILDFIPED